MDNEEAVYRKSAVETCEILRRFDKSMKDKIPKEIFVVFNEVADKSYKFVYDDTKPLYEQKVMPETVEFIAMIFHKYCENKETENPEKPIAEETPEISEKTEVMEETKLEEIEEPKEMIVRKDNVFQRIGNWFKKLFKKG